MDLDMGTDPGVLMALFYPWYLWCQVYNRPGKTRTEAEFVGKAAILVKAQPSSNVSCELAVLLKAASGGLDANARKPWRSPPDQEPPSVTGPELKQLRQDLSDAIGQPMSM